MEILIRLFRGEQCDRWLVGSIVLLWMDHHRTIDQHATKEEDNAKEKGFDAYAQKEQVRHHPLVKIRATRRTVVPRYLLRQV